MTTEFPTKRYQIIYADPAWSYHHNRVIRGNATNHYETMRVQDICDLPVKEIADTNCLLFMWAVSPSLPDAIKVGEAWGFTYKIVAFVWDKQRVLCGSYTMSQCELCLVFKRGTIPKPRGERNVRQFLSERRERHSEKPSEVRDRIDKMFPAQSKVELFARQRVVGWDAWGNEI